MCLQIELGNDYADAADLPARARPPSVTLWHGRGRPSFSKATSIPARRLTASGGRSRRHTHDPRRTPWLPGTSEEHALAEELYDEMNDRVLDADDMNVFSVAFSKAVDRLDAPTAARRFSDQGTTWAAVTSRAAVEEAQA